MQIDQVDVFGMRLQQTRVVVRVEEGRVLIDPIDSTLNGGRLHLDPELIVDKQGVRWLHLGRTSSLIDAEINDEVSHRVLSYVAPVLDQATRVQGRISLDLVFANVPLGGEDAQARIEGDVQFDDVEFMPGPLVDDLIGVFRLERRPLMVLRDPISVRILGRKIYQEGLILPVGNVAVIGIDGWVDFDKNLDLLASFAVVPPKQNIPVLSQILESTQLQVPIKGTLDNPKINGDAIKDRFKNMGDALLETALGIGGGGLGRIFQGGGGRPRPEAEVIPPLEGPEDELDAAPGDKPAPVDPLDEPAQAGDAAPKGPMFPNLRLPGSLTPEQRQLQREARQQRRLDKRAERRRAAACRRIKSNVESRKRRPARRPLWDRMESCLPLTEQPTGGDCWPRSSRRCLAVRLRISRRPRRPLRQEPAGAMPVLRPPQAEEAFRLQPVASSASRAGHGPA